MNKLKVMVVDDSLVMTQLVSKALGELGHQVVKTAKSGTEAIAGYAECKPDLVTMDITMPGISGIEAAEKIIQAHPAAHIIMVTSHAQKSMVTDSIKVGAKGYVLKPIQTETLREAIEKSYKKA
jgi:two-component system, chemotaxis family, chemotaxis protein CheY